jgi:multiple sugar transport system ATP-binding protein
VTIGVRAEDIAVSPSPAAGSDEARVLVVEPMGSETLLTLEYRAQRLVARVAGDAGYEPGQSAWVHLPPDRVLTFDASGARIS